MNSTKAYFIVLSLLLTVFVQNLGDRFYEKIMKIYLIKGHIVK